MIEPDAPTTIWIKQPTYPAFLLASDEGRPLKPSSIILRHRHLCQQQRVSQSGAPYNEPSSGRLVRRTVVGTAVADAHGSRSAGPSTCGISSVPSTSGVSSEPSTPSVALRPLSPSLSVANDANQTVLPISPVSGTASGTKACPRANESLPPPDRANTTNATPSVSARSKTVDTSIGPLFVTYQERALRARGNKPHVRREKTVWYFSSSHQFLDVPPMLADVSLGDLYIHEGPDRRKQVWMWSKNSSWSSLQIAAPHPYLADYILNFCGNGEPSWVTKETLRTYIGRVRKREADQQTSDSRQSSSVPATE